MNFLCPACRTPLPNVAATTVLPCTQCGVEVDVARIETSPGQGALRADVDLAGETLGRFQLLDRLGAGGMGVVYAATSEGKPFAVKVLGGMLAADPALRTRFRREAAALRAIEHPNVVRVFEEGEERGFCWYAMERVEGSDLRTKLRAGALDFTEVENLARALLDALAAVHAAGFIHRDVKPGNVLLTKDDVPKLCDFGIAHVDGAATLTESAAILGSLRYMASEQRLGRATASSDLHALGITLHEALTGGSVPDEAPLPKGTPRRLRKLVDLLSQPRAVDRPPSALAALRLLEPSRVPARARWSGVAALIALAVFLWATLRPAPAPIPIEVKDVARVKEAPAPKPAEPVKAVSLPTPAPTPVPPAPAKPTPRVEDLRKTSKEGEPLPPLEPPPLATPRAKPLDYEKRLAELDKKDPAKGAAVKSKLRKLDPTSTIGTGGSLAK